MSKSKNHISSVQRFWQLMKPDAREIRNVYVYAVFNGLVALSLPLGIQAIVNFIQGGQISSSWILLVCLVVLGVAATGVLQIFQLRIIENLQQKIFTRAAFEFAYRIPRVKMESMYKHHAPELMNRFFDVMGIQKGLSKILVDISAAGLQMIFGLILLSLYHPFFIVFSIALVLLVLAIFSYTGPRGLKTSLQESKNKYRVAHWLEEIARTYSTFKLAGNTSLPLQHVDGHVKDYLGAREAHFKVLVQQYYLMIFFKVIVATGLLAIGGILVMEQHMNIGQFIAAEIIILLVMTSVEKLVLSLETIYDVLTSLEKVGEVTDLELEKTKGINLEEACDDCGIEVEFNEVSFSYPEKGRQVLDDVSIKFGSGETWGLMGYNGSGKSTMLHLMAGLYEAQKGTLSYNGLPMGNLNLNSLRLVTGDSLSSEQLFEGSVMDNITMGRDHISLDDVQWAVDNMGLSDFIKNLPSGFDTQIEPQGKKIPRGYVQRLMLARAIASRPKLILLEDALGHIDAKSRLDIIQFLTDKKHGWTLIASASDPVLLGAMDKVAYVENGRIKATAPYINLLSSIDHA